MPCLAVGFDNDVSHDVSLYPTRASIYPIHPLTQIIFQELVKMFKRIKRNLLEDLYTFSERYFLQSNLSNLSAKVMEIIFQIIAIF